MPHILAHNCLMLHFCWKCHNITDFILHSSHFTLSKDLLYKLVMTLGPNLYHPIWLQHLWSSLAHKAKSPGGVNMPKGESKKFISVPFKSSLTKTHPNFHSLFLPCFLKKMILWNHLVKMLFMLHYFVI